MRNHGRNTEEWVKRIHAIPAFLTLKCAHIVTKENFLDLRVLLECNSLIIVSKLIKESFSIQEVLCDILLWLTFIELIMHAVEHVPQEFCWVMLLKSNKLRSHFWDGFFYIRRGNATSTSLTNTHEQLAVSGANLRLSCSILLVLPTEEVFSQWSCGHNALQSWIHKASVSNIL